MFHQKSLIRSLTCVLCLIFAAAAVGTVAAQMPDDSPIEAFYLARDDGEGYAGEAATSFLTTDVPIHCVIELKSDAVATVRMNFVAVSVTGVKSGTRIVSSSYTTKDSENIVKFRGGPSDRWMAGTYRVDIFVGNKLSATQEFPIVQRPVPAAQMRFVEGKPKPLEPNGKPKPRPRKNN